MRDASRVKSLSLETRQKPSKRAGVQQVHRVDDHRAVGRVLAGGVGELLDGWIECSSSVGLPPAELRRGPVAVDALDAGDAERRDLGEQPGDDDRVRVVGVDQHREVGVVFSRDVIATSCPAIGHCARGASIQRGSSKDSAISRLRARICSGDSDGAGLIFPEKYANVLNDVTAGSPTIPKGSRFGSALQFCPYAKTTNCEPLALRGPGHGGTCRSRFRGSARASSDDHGPPDRLRDAHRPAREETN